MMRLGNDLACCMGIAVYYGIQYTRIDSIMDILMGYLTMQLNRMIEVMWLGLVARGKGCSQLSYSID